MKKFIFKLSVLFVIIALICILLSILYDNHFRKNLNMYEKSYWIFSQYNQSYDYAFLGSSRAFHMVDVVLIDSTMKTKGINLGTDGTGFPENYLIFRRFLNNNNKIKILFIQVDMYCLDPKNSFSYPFHDYLYVPFLNEEIVDSVFKDNVAPFKYYLWKYVPFAKYMEFNNYYPISLLLLKSKDRLSNLLFDKGKGTTLLEGKMKTEPIIYDKQRQIYSGEEKYLIKLIKYCNQNMIEVVFYSAPQFNNLFKYPFISDFNNHTKDIIEHIASENKIKYFDFERSDLCQHKEYFIDYTHLNSIGTSLFTRQFIDSLKINQIFKN